MAQNRTRKAIVAAALTGGVLASGAVHAVETPAGPKPINTPRVEGAAEWTACAPDEADAFSSVPLDCATVEVPLDYDHPRGPTVGIVMKRRPADDPARKIGTLFVNPGGPGASGVAVAPFFEQIFRPEVLARFDVVGFDPRGIARSWPLICLPSAEDGFALLAGLPPFPVTWREDVGFASAIRTGLSEPCAQRDPAVLDHMSTGNAARDLDRLRAAVGDRRLTYFGVSYGTQLGVTYANLFPRRVRALVLDATLDPVAWTSGTSRAQGRRVPVTVRLQSPRSASLTLDRFFELCSAAGPAGCALATGDPAARYRGLARQLRREPVVIDLGDGSSFELRYADLVAISLQTLYDPFSWAELAAFVDAVAGPAPAALRSSSLRQLQRSLEAPYDEQSIEGFPGVLCTDATNPKDPRAWSVAGRLQDARWPYFGRSWTWQSIPCASWPGRDRDRYAGPWNARTASPVLVVGGLFDPATGYHGAQTVARLLPRSRLLTFDGEGHVASGLSGCIDAAESAYLLSRELPPRGTVCRTDVDPFPVAPPSARRGPAEERQEIAHRVLVGAPFG